MAPSQVAAGSVQGQVIGDHNTVTLNFYSDNGVQVGRAAATPPPPQPLPRPVHLLPPAFPRLIAPGADLDAAFGAPGRGAPLELHGPAGIGKARPVRVLAHRPRTVRPPDGVVFHGCQGEPPADLVQILFEAFYEVPS